MSSFIPKVRGAFSDRNNIDKISDIIQKYEFDERTRKRLIIFFDETISVLKSKSTKAFERTYRNIYTNIFICTKDDIPYDYEGYDDNRRLPIVNGLEKDWSYDQILSFLEEYAKMLAEEFDDGIYELLNEILKEECVGYRFIDGIATDIISDEEISEIDKAINNNSTAAGESIKKAVRLLYDRDNPDYENAVKDAILAVEAMCNIINGTNKDTLGKALNKLEKNNIKIHPSLKEAFLKLYGYTSDQNGIRHNGGLDDNTTFDEAKFMVITCSAFINYLNALNSDN